MIRVAGPRSRHIRPIAPAEDAVTRWLAFHAYWLASGVFCQGRAAEEILRSDMASGGVLGQRQGGGDPTAPLLLPDVTVEVDDAARTVTLRAPDGTSRTAGDLGRYGCVIYPEGATQPPLPVHPAPPSLAAAPIEPDDPPVGELDAVAKRITSDGLGRAFVVLHDGQLVAENYAAPFDRNSRHPGWSMTKSLVGALAGRLVRLGWLSLDQPAPIPEWQADERAGITVGHLLRMESGLDCPGGLTPWAMGDKHFRVYSGLSDVYGYVAGLPARAQAGTRCAYQNSDAIALAAVVRETALAHGIPFVDAPWELLFDPLGMHSTVLHADPAGNFILSGFSTATALDWARFGQLYLDDGRWQGNQLLPAGWLDYALTPAPSDDEPVYGGALLWLGHQVLGERLFGRNPLAAQLPPCLMAAGHYGQRVIIIPDHRLVVVRLGHGLNDDLLLETILEIIAIVGDRETGTCLL